MGRMLILALLILAACQQAAATPEAEGERFHRLYNAGDHAALYRGTSEIFSSSIDEAMFDELMRVPAAQFGAMRQAELRSVRRYSREDGEFVVLRYDTAFERGAAHEAIVYRVGEDGRLELEGYQIEAPGWPGMMMGEFASLLEEGAADGRYSERPES